MDLIPPQPGELESIVAKLTDIDVEVYLRSEPGIGGSWIDIPIDGALIEVTKLPASLRPERFGDVSVFTIDVVMQDGRAALSAPGIAAAYATTALVPTIVRELKERLEQPAQARLGGRLDQQLVLDEVPAPQHLNTEAAEMPYASSAQPVPGQKQSQRLGQ